MNRHSILLLGALFAVGMLLHVLKRANYAVMGKRFDSMRAWFQFYWVNLLIRSFFQILIFLAAATEPDFLRSLMLKFGMTMAIELPVTLLTAPAFGYFGDSVLDWATSKVPFLQKEIPPVNGETASINPQQILEKAAAAPAGKDVNV